MLVIKGKYNYAKIFLNEIDEKTKNQIKLLLDQEFIKESVIRIIPDCHCGKGSVIGLTMTLHGKVVPNLVGVDIGCGMKVVNLGIFVVRKSYNRQKAQDIAYLVLFCYYIL